MIDSSGQPDRKNIAPQREIRLSDRTSSFGCHRSTNGRKNHEIAHRRLVQEIQSLPPNELVTAGADLDYGIYVAVVSQGTVRKFVKIAKVE